MPPEPASRNGARLTDQQRLAWLRLIRSENVGPITFRQLLNHFGSAASALDALPDLAARNGRRIKVATAEEAAAEYDALTAFGAGLVALGEPDYPPWLRHGDDAPPLLAIHGRAECLRRPAVAIVGSRNASVAGRKLAMMLAADLGSLGYLIVSGLARGIDGAAHEAALPTGTVAVLAGGIDSIYPPEHAKLAARILETGAHLSEMPFGWEPRARDFPRRNRIVSGLALGVVVVEAAERSGSLITARFAGEQGRIVFAVPGSPLDPRATGTNRLIKDGALLVENVDDIVSVLEPMVGKLPAPPAVPAGAGFAAPRLPEEIDGGQRERVVEALGPTPTSIDEIVRFTGLPPAVVHLVLVELDLAGRIERHGAGRVSLV